MGFLRKLLEHYKQTLLQGKIFYVLVIAGAFFASVNTVLNLMIGLTYSLIVISLFTTLFCISLLVYAYIFNNYQRAALVGFWGVILGILPALWITNAGSQGPTGYFMIFILILVGIILEKKEMYATIFLEIAVIMILILVEYNMPQIIIGYDNDTTKLLDLGISALLVAIFSLVIIRNLMGEYNRKINELNEVQMILHRLSITDELTGIYNRRYVMNAIRNKLNAKIYSPFSLIMYDIDNFKKINDEFGHSVGDEVIKNVGWILQHNVRSEDIVGRIGGEEFLVLLVDTDEVMARQKAEFFRRSIEAYEWKEAGLKVTVSGGVYEHKKQADMDSMLEKVDQLLYQAKHSGKNQVL